MIYVGRVANYSAQAIYNAVAADTRISVHPLDSFTVLKTIDLAGIREMHDRQIVATALTLAENHDTVVVLSRDGNIQSSGLVTTDW